MISNQLTMAEILALPPAFKLEVAGRAFGYGRTKSHELQRAGDFPCKVQRKGRGPGAYIVTKAALFEGLGIPLEFLFATDAELVTRRLAERSSEPHAGAA
jgi:hypothetical protein